ncbi:hypothetical protein BKA70DRAFT_1476577 [Coprinopsis sp. MPI-PUGE-AT-0042]|nr:hypothetical protein BKA70DRAFT_1476577 [Coprinopsis sp. MPI-PUGE-AT-0042]
MSQGRPMRPFSVPYSLAPPSLVRWPAERVLYQEECQGLCGQHTLYFIGSKFCPSWTRTLDILRHKLSFAETSREDDREATIKRLELQLEKSEANRQYLLEILNERLETELAHHRAKEAYPSSRASTPKTSPSATSASSVMFPLEDTESVTSAAPSSSGSYASALRTHDQEASIANTHGTTFRTASLHQGGMLNATNSEPSKNDPSGFLSAQIARGRSSTAAEHSRRDIVPSTKPREAVTIHPAPSSHRTSDRRRATCRVAAEGPKLTNPMLEDPVELWQEYYRVHKASWPRGVRADSGGGPLKSDLRADRAIAQMCPGSEYVPEIIEASAIRPRTNPSEDEDGVPRPQPPKPLFKAILANLFASPGAYEQRVRELGVIIIVDFRGSPCYRRFNHPSLTTDAVVRHLAQCGVTFQMAARDFEPWSLSFLADRPQGLAQYHKIATARSFAMALIVPEAHRATEAAIMARQS